MYLIKIKTIITNRNLSNDLDYKKYSKVVWKGPKYREEIGTGPLNGTKLTIKETPLKAKKNHS